MSIELVPPHQSQPNQEPALWRRLAGTLLALMDRIELHLRHGFSAKHSCDLCGQRWKHGLGYRPAEKEGEPPGLGGYDFLRAVDANEAAKRRYLDCMAKGLAYAEAALRAVALVNALPWPAAPSAISLDC